VPNIGSIAVAAESSFGSLAAATGIPDSTGLSFTSLECDKAGVTYDGQEFPNVDDWNYVRSGAGQQPPIPVTINSSGSPVRRRTGTFTIRAPMRMIGSATTYGAYGLMPLVQVLNSGLALSSAAATTDDVSVAIDANSWTPTTVGNLPEGAMVQWTENNRVEYSAVTDNASDVTISPAFSGTPQAADTIRLADVLYPVVGTSGSTGNSVAIRFDAQSHRFIAFGCRLESVTFELEQVAGGALVFANMTIRAAHITDDDGNASVSNPSLADGSVATFLQSYFVYSDAISGSAPYSLARNTLDLDSWSCTITNTWQAQGASSSILGVSGYDISDQTITLEATGAVDATLRSDFQNERTRQIVVGCGRQGVGNGFAIQIAAAALTADSVPVEGAEGLFRQSYNWRGAPYAGDTAGSLPANTVFRIGLFN
jgi:hypothetical protein